MYENEFREIKNILANLKGLGEIDSSEKCYMFEIYSQQFDEFINRIDIDRVLFDKTLIGHQRIYDNFTAAIDEYKLYASSADDYISSQVLDKLMEINNFEVKPKTQSYNTNFFYGGHYEKRWENFDKNILVDEKEKFDILGKEVEDGR